MGFGNRLFFMAGLINPSSGNVQYPTQYPGNFVTCACGADATRILYNPKGISYNITEIVPSIYLCSGCDFRYTVMRAAGRSEEFVAEYEEKQRAIAEKNRIAQEEEMKAYQAMKQGLYNVYGQSGLSGQTVLQNQQNAYYDLLAEGFKKKSSPTPDPSTENVQSPADPEPNPWWKRW